MKTRSDLYLWRKNPMQHLKSIQFLFCFALLLCSFQLSCKKGKSDPGESSFTKIQKEILNVSCAKSGCHASTGDAAFAQHGLVLAEGASYNNLINIIPKNTAATAAGLSRVKPGESLRSLLYHKIICDDAHHVSGFGQTMPLGGPYLSAGQIQFIKEWIDKGAPEKGAVANPDLLKDNVSCSVSFTPLAPPSANEGFQLAINTFDVNPNFEREVFVRRNMPNNSDVFVNRFKLKGRNNSHHFVLYAFQNPSLLPPLNDLRDLRNPDGSLVTSTLFYMQNHIFLAGGTDVNTDYTFPPGVAMRFPAAFPVDLNAHYFNKSNLIIKGENYINFYTVPQASVINEAKTLNLNNTDITIAPGERKTIIKTFTFSSITRVLMLTSHNHQLGEKFIIKIAGGTRNGEVVYESTDWQHPLIKNFDTPIQLQPGHGLTSEVTYFNNTSKTVKFGLTSEDEMNIIFGYYY
jgi:Copper type II ascorbate-dependent monooxygenase, C-terminal domain